MAKRSIPKEEVQHVLRLVRAGKHLRQVARLSGVSTRGVTGIAARHGLTLAEGPDGRPRDMIRIRAITELYRLLGTQKEVARRIGASRSMVANDITLAANLPKLAN